MASMGASMELREGDGRQKTFLLGRGASGRERWMLMNGGPLSEFQALWT